MYDKHVTFLYWNAFPCALRRHYLPNRQSAQTQQFPYLNLYCCQSVPEDQSKQLPGALDPICRRLWKYVLDVWPIHVTSPMGSFQLDWMSWVWEGCSTKRRLKLWSRLMFAESISEIENIWLLISCAVLTTIYFSSFRRTWNTTCFF